MSDCKIPLLRWESLFLFLFLFLGGVRGILREDSATLRYSGTEPDLS